MNPNLLFFSEFILVFGISVFLLKFSKNNQIQFPAQLLDQLQKCHSRLGFGWTSCGNFWCQLPGPHAGHGRPSQECQENSRYSI
jgi:hypothetical protein